MLLLLGGTWSMDWTPKEKKSVSTIEERLQALEREHTQLKKTIELQTIAIRALVSKEALEKLQDTVEKIQEQNGKTIDKVDLLAIDNRNTRQSLERAETSQESLKLDFERQEKRIVHFERQTNDQLTDIKADTTILKEQFIETDGKVAGLQTEMRQTAKQTEVHFEKVETRFDRMETLLAQIIERLPNKP
jgi:chromosome segregation ATPase